MNRHDRDPGRFGMTAPFDTSATELLVRELNHRVRNNFQIIASLMNLQKRLLPPERRDDIRFIEEHVQSMAAAYRLVHATGGLVEVPIHELIFDVADGLRQIAAAGTAQLLLAMPTVQGMINLDRAIAVALYLAVVLPPYLDRAAASDGTVRIDGVIEGAQMRISITENGKEPIAMNFLRGRLMAAYRRQLDAEPAGDDETGHLLRLPLPR